jgi:hypothetical protein
MQMHAYECIKKLNRSVRNEELPIMVAVDANNGCSGRTFNIFCVIYIGSTSRNKYTRIC